MTDRPNVLWILTDQQFAGAMGCAGNDDLETPAMDRLAREGARFESAYCECPLCVPSRASMLTGQPASEALDREGPFAIAEEHRDGSVGRRFEQAGYRAAYAGKWHLSEGGSTDAGNGRHRSGRHSMTPGGEAGFEVLCGMDDRRVVETCTEFLAADHDRPFLLAASFENPHNICEWTDGKTPAWGAVESVPLEECPTLPPNFAVPPNEPSQLRPAAERDVVDYQLEGCPDEEWRRYRHVYYRLIERVDDQVGRLLEALDAEGLAEDTLVVFTSDHGDGHGAHGLGHKMFLYEESARVPLIVRPPGGTERRTVDAPVNTGLDLLLTLCDYAGIEAAGPGESLRPLVDGRTVPREYVVTRSRVPIPGRMVRTDRHKYIVYEGGRNREQLFDVAADPGELVDLSVDADHEAVLSEHRRHLLEWCQQTDDLFAELSSRPGVPSVPGYEYDELEALFADGQA